jgi:hypothetical protein
MSSTLGMGVVDPSAALLAGIFTETPRSTNSSSSGGGSSSSKALSHHHSSHAAQLSSYESLSRDARVSEAMSELTAPHNYTLTSAPHHTLTSVPHHHSSIEDLSLSQTQAQQLYDTYSAAAAAASSASTSASYSVITTSEPPGSIYSSADMNYDPVSPATPLSVDSGVTPHPSDTFATMSFQVTVT